MFIKVLALLFGLILLVHFAARAEVLYQFNQQGVTVKLHSTACKLPEVKNLQKRAEWIENGVITEACWGGSPLGLVMFYAADKTVFVIPMEYFERVTGI